MSLPFDEKKFKNGKYHMSPNKRTVKYSCTLSSYKPYPKKRVLSTSRKCVQI